MRMTRGKRVLGCGRDDGMTVLEVVIAISIFFFVLTALFGLLGTTTAMSLKSNERAIVTNAVNSYIEEIRAMPYAGVGLDVSGAPVPGDLSAETTRTVGGLVLTFTPEVSWVNDPMIEGSQNYKEVTVTAVARRGGLVVFQTSMSTFIRQEEPPGEYEAPKVAFVAGSPEDATPPTIIRGEVLVSAWAETEMPGATLVSMAFRVRPGEWYLPGAGGDNGMSALWTLTEKTATRSFTWDTRAMTEAGDDGISVPMTPDGTYTLVVEVMDSNQKVTRIERRVFIDNNDPDAPGVPVADTTVSGLSVPLSWTRSMDGIEEADHYRLDLGVQALDGGWTNQLITTSSSLGAHTVATQPFSRYSVRVQAESRDASHRSAWSPAPAQDPVFFITRPLVQGRYVATFEGKGKSRAWDVDVHITTGAPTFPRSFAEYRLMERVGTGPWVEVARNSTGVFVYNFDVSANNNNQLTIERRYRVEVDVRYAVSDPTVTVRSNALGPVVTGTSGSSINFPSPGAW